MNDARRVLREILGREVRAEWVAWAKEQPNPKPSWLVPWEGLSEFNKEVDRRIGERLFNLGRAGLHGEDAAHAADIPRAGQRAREAALTAPYRLAAHEESSE